MDSVIAIAIGPASLWVLILKVAVIDRFIPPLNVDPGNSIIQVKMFKILSESVFSVYLELEA